MEVVCCIIRGSKRIPGHGKCSFRRSRDSCTDEQHDMVLGNHRAYPYKHFQTMLLAEWLEEPNKRRTRDWVMWYTL